MTTTTQPGNKRDWIIIIAITIAILLLALLSSCNPCKRLSRLCPVETHDSVVYRETVTIDTLIQVIPGDTTYLETKVPCDDFELKQENADQKIEISVLNGILWMRTICKEDSLRVIIANLKTELRDKKTVTVKKIVKVPVKKLGKFAKVCIWYSIISWIVVLLYVAYKIFKPKIPFVK